MTFSFKNCRSLQHIPIPTTVKEIKDFAFRNCEQTFNIDGSTEKCCYNYSSNIQGLYCIGMNPDSLFIDIEKRGI